MERARPAFATRTFGRAGVFFTGAGPSVKRIAEKGTRPPVAVPTENANAAVTTATDAKTTFMLLAPLQAGVEAPAQRRVVKLAANYVRRCLHSEGTTDRDLCVVYADGVSDVQTFAARLKIDRRSGDPGQTARRVRITRTAYGRTPPADGRIGARTVPSGASLVYTVRNIRPASRSRRSSDPSVSVPVARVAPGPDSCRSIAPFRPALSLSMLTANILAAGTPVTVTA